MQLSPETRKRVDFLFLADAREEVIRLLEESCGTNLPFCENKNEFELERIRYAALKLSNGDVKRLRDAVRLASIDWRDLLMAAGFGYDATIHNSWLPNGHHG